VLQEDDLADEIAECILASSIGLALVSSSPRSNLSAGRLLNLKDRLSSEALQATLKVFRIKPPTGAVKEEEKGISPQLSSYIIVMCIYYDLNKLVRVLLYLQGF